MNIYSHCCKYFSRNILAELAIIAASYAGEPKKPTFAKLPGCFTIANRPINDGVLQLNRTPRAWVSDFGYMSMQTTESDSKEQSPRTTYNRKKPIPPFRSRCSKGIANNLTNNQYSPLHLGLISLRGTFSLSLFVKLLSFRIKASFCISSSSRQS